MIQGQYGPDIGNVVWLGAPHRLRRRAVGLSPAAYNGRIGLPVCCPVTIRIKDYPIEGPLAGSPPSVALADQVKSLDWRRRGAVDKGGDNIAYWGIAVGVWPLGL